MSSVYLFESYKIYFELQRRISGSIEAASVGSRWMNVDMMTIQSPSSSSENSSYGALHFGHLNDQSNYINVNKLKGKILRYSYR